MNRSAYIWVTNKTTEGWSDPKYLGPPFDEAMFVCVSDDLTIYNSGLQKSELHVGQYGPWENIAPHLYGPYMHPCIGPNEEYIIFDSEQNLEGKGNALLISFRHEDGTWGEIISFRNILDIEGRYGIPMLSPDGKFLFFTHNGDIYWVDAGIIDKLRQYDQQRSVENWEKETFLKQPPEKIMDAVGIKPGMIIGEVGAGRGRFTMHLARRVGTEGKILANDIDAEGLAFLTERCQRAGIHNISTILGEVDDPHFPEEALDMVFMVWTYHFFDQPIIMLKKLRPALKSGGTIVLVEPDPVRGPGGADHGISPDRMRKDAEQAGYEVVQIEEFLPEDLIFVLKIRD